VGFSDRQNSIALIADFIVIKPVAFVCHSPGHWKRKVNGEFLVKGKKTYRFSNEEAAVGLTDVVPFY
jgi:hypothetical protein